MKKQITRSIIGLSIILLSSSSFANSFNQSAFFVKAHVSGNKFNNAKQYRGFTAKSQTSPSVALGLGYYMRDNFRTDLTFEYYINPTFKLSVKDHELSGSFKLKQNVELATLMVNGNADIIELGASSIFLGAGVGVAKHKTKYHVTGISVEGDEFDQKYSTKVSYNFAYSIGAGAAYSIFDGFNAELAYSWRGFGSTKPKKNSEGESITRKISYRSHNVSLGLRIDI